MNGGLNLGSSENVITLPYDFGQEILNFNDSKKMFAQAQPTSDATEDGKTEKVGKEEKDRGGLPGIICSVCLNRPVQVIVSPCLIISTALSSTYSDRQYLRK